MKKNEHRIPDTTCTASQPVKARGTQRTKRIQSGAAALALLLLLSQLPLTSHAADYSDPSEEIIDPVITAEDAPAPLTEIRSQDLRIPASAEAKVIISYEGEKDYTDIIQESFIRAAAQKIPVYFENPTPEHAFHISKNIYFPDNLEAYGNGNTIAVDSNYMDKFSPAKTNTSNDGKYREFCILSEGMLTKSITTFSLTELNFTLRDDHDGKGIPKVMMGLGNMKDIEIIDCTFSTYSDIQLGLTTFDVYTNWQDLHIKGCTFNVMHEGYMGGVWLRNFNGDTPSTNALIEDCTFNNKSADEVLTIYAQFPSIFDSYREMSDVTVRNCQFNCYTSDYNNPAHLITLGNTGRTTNILFEDNEIYMDAVWNSVIKMKAHGTRGEVDGITVRNNKIVVDDILNTANQIITGDDLPKTALVEGNSITVNTKSGLKKMGMTGNYTVARNNEFYGNGFSTVFSNVRHVEGNYIEQCDSAFIGALTVLNNQVDDCNSNFHMTNSINLTPDPKNIQEILLQGNQLSSKNLAKITVASSYDLYCHLVLRDNIVTGGIVRGNNPTATMALYNNEFTMRHLDDLNFYGGITKMEKNRLRDIQGNPLVHGNALPKGAMFNNSLLPGVLLEIEPEFYADDPDPVVAYGKIKAGNTPDSWRILRFAS